MTETTAPYASKHARSCVRRASGLVLTRDAEICSSYPMRPALENLTAVASCSTLTRRSSHAAKESNH